MFFFFQQTMFRIVYKHITLSISVLYICKVSVCIQYVRTRCTFLTSILQKIKIILTQSQIKNLQELFLFPRGFWNTAQSHPHQRTKKSQIFLDRLCQAATLLKKCMPQSQSTEIAFSLYMWYFLWGKNLTIAMGSEKPSPRNTHNWITLYSPGQI